MYRLWENKYHLLLKYVKGETLCVVLFNYLLVINKSKYSENLSINWHFHRISYKIEIMIGIEGWDKGEGVGLCDEGLKMSEQEMSWLCSMEWLRVEKG